MIKIDYHKTNIRANQPDKRWNMKALLGENLGLGALADNAFHWGEMYWMIMQWSWRYVMH